jgi:DNA-binding CsgD family transcriptional regulator
MVNQAAHLLGAAHIRTGAAIDGLLLLRAPVRDWLLRGDTRVWGVLHSIANGLAASGDLTAATRLAAAIGDRHLQFVSEAERVQLRSLLKTGLSDEDRARHERAGQELDAGAAVAEALRRIEALAPSDTTAARPTDADAGNLTARQQDVAALVARGFTNKQIAHRLGISRFTAETHVRNILERLGAASRTEIAAWAARRQD